MSAFVYLILFVMLLLLSGFLSGAETAFFSIQGRLRTYGERDVIPENIQQILRRPRRLLISLLTGNTLVNIAMAFLAALLVTDMAYRFELNLAVLLLLESLVVTTIVLLFGEVMPKILALRKTETFARLASPMVKAIVALLYPLGSLIYALTHLLTSLLGIRPESMFSSEEELKGLAEVGLDRGTLEVGETEIIHSIFDFTDTAVHEVMTPRVDILALNSQAGLDEALELVRTRQVSKIPIFKDSVDHIRGILYAKDILPYLDGPRPDVNLLRLARPPFFVPESKNVVSLLQDFKERRTSIAIVVDEFGGTAGLVTLEDVVEEVLGELRDPYDLGEAEIVPLGIDEFLVDAAISLDDLSERLGCSFPEEREYDSLGGFMFDLFDQIPMEGQAIEHEGRRFSVKAIQGNRIAKVQISPYAAAKNERSDDT